MANITKVGSLRNLIDDEKTVKSVTNKNVAGTMNSAFSGNCQVYLNGGKYYCESSCERRGAVPDINNGITVYDIAAFIKEPTIKSIKDSFLNILREKIKNDCAAFEGLVEQMKKDGHLPQSVICDSDELFDEFFAVGKKVSILGEKSE